MNTNLFFVAIYLIVACFCYITWRKYKDKDFLYLSLISLPAALNRILENFPSNFIYQTSGLKLVTDVIFFFLWSLGMFFAIKIFIRGLIRK